MGSFRLRKSRLRGGDRLRAGGGSGSPFLITAVTPTESFSPSPIPAVTVIPDSPDGSAMQIEWQWATNASFTANLQLLTTLGNTDNVPVSSQPTNPLTSGTKYYWRARAGDGSQWSGWTDARTITYLLNVGDAVIWTYINTGFGGLNPTREAVFWAYLNVGFTLTPTREAVEWVYVGDVNTGIPTPHIWFLRPTAGREGDGFSIYGHGFGANNAVYNGHAWLEGIQLSETAWQQIAAGVDAYTPNRKIDEVVGEPTMEHQRIDVTVPSGAVDGFVRVETNI